MKKNKFINILAVLLTMAIFVGSCTKENTEVKLDPKLSTAEVLNLTSDSATVVGFVIASGSGFTEKGVCYNTSPDPTTDNSKVIYTGESTAATFNVILSGLDYATTYYARAYGINASGTLYGEEFSFTTLPVKPTVTTAEVTGVTGTTAVSGGNISNDGGAEITARGVCYNTEANPTIDNMKTVDGTGSGEFTSSISGLEGLTMYYVRAYATNSAGTSYGEEYTFTTDVSIRTWYIPGDYVAESYPGSTFNNWDPANSPKIISSDAQPNKLEGYVYMANETNQWKFATQANWNGPNYGDDNGSGVLDPNAANNITSPSGYYKIIADAAALTYTAVATEWGVIGDATPLGWDDETPLMYDPASQTWRGGLHMSANKFKFRANHSWDYNYGSDDNLNLVAGGTDIPVATEADYYVTLDLSHPNAYTFTANYWGLIGDATPDGWNSDQNMTWDPVNQAMTITLDLVAGTIKFRANDAWDINLGGDPDALTPGGDNIPIGEAGNYTITLYFTPGSGHCTIVKN